MSGKSDVIDAEHAARLVLTGPGPGTATPKTADGNVEALRLLKIARDTAVKARSAAMITLKATLVTASDALREDLEPLSPRALIQACAGFPAIGRLVDPDAAMRHVLRSLAQRWSALDKEIAQHSLHVKSQTAALAPALVSAVGVGPDTAAEMLIVVGDNSNRIRSESAFAKMCGACPITAGSGHTNGRHRLYRGGNRQANAALYRVVIVRMRWHEPTRAYVARRTAEGLSKREIIRCPKRYLAREIYRLLPAPANQQFATPAGSATTLPVLERAA